MEAQWPACVKVASVQCLLARCMQRAGLRLLSRVPDTSRRRQTHEATGAVNHVEGGAAVAAAAASCTASWFKLARGATCFPVAWTMFAGVAICCNKRAER